MALTALSVASPLTAADEARKTPLRIDAEEHFLAGIREFSGTGAGTFTLLGASTADSDSGRLTFKFSYGGISKTADGQSFQPFRRWR